MRTLIVDHEPCVRETLRNLCESDDSIDEVSEAESGVTAIKMIRARRPDLLLLDVELSDMTGFDVLRSLNDARRPPVIMVTAHEQHAVEAFRIGAIDYLTKPVNADRFATAIKRVHERRKSESTNVQGPIAANSPRRSSTVRLIGENSHRLYFLAVDEDTLACLREQQARQLCANPCRDAEIYPPRHAQTPGCGAARCGVRVDWQINAGQSRTRRICRKARPRRARVYAQVRRSAHFEGQGQNRGAPRAPPRDQCRVSRGDLDSNAAWRANLSSTVLLITRPSRALPRRCGDLQYTVALRRTMWPRT